MQSLALLFDNMINWALKHNHIQGEKSMSKSQDSKKKDKKKPAKTMKEKKQAKRDKKDKKVNPGILNP